ncbi:MAG: FkbM family methyltransferase [Gemmataceae bacterium]
MSTETPPSVPTPQEPAPSPAAPAGGIRRRDVVVGLLGMAGGAAIRQLTVQRTLPEDARPTFAQFAEDILISDMVQDLKIDHPTYLDIGSADPVKVNNTYLLYVLGGRGVLVEPNPAFHERTRKLRPEDKLLPVGIGISDATEADYFMFNYNPLNTFDPEQVERLKKSPEVKLVKTVKMPLVNINRAIEENFGGKAPDIISIDIEGLDLAILRTLDFAKYRPKLVCAETIMTNTPKHNPDTTPFMIGHGYEVRGMTLANTIYVDSKLLQ